MAISVTKQPCVSIVRCFNFMHILLVHLSTKKLVRLVLKKAYGATVSSPKLRIRVERRENNFDRTSRIWVSLQCSCTLNTIGEWAEA